MRIIWRGYGANVIVAQEGPEALWANDELLPILLHLFSKQPDSCPVRVVVVGVEVFCRDEVSNLAAISVLLPVDREMSLHKVYFFFNFQ